MEADETLKANFASCAICAESKGIIVKVQSSVVPQLANQWVHIMCVNWIPQIKFRNAQTKKDIVYFDSAAFN